MKVLSRVQGTLDLEDSWDFSLSLTASTAFAQVSAL